VETEDKAVLSYFAAVQFVRVPNFRSRIEQFIVDIAETIKSLMTKDRDADGYQISANPQAALGHGLRAVPIIADRLNRMSWAIMEPASDENYWTCDNPVYWINPDSSHPVIGHGLDAKGIEVNLPIGPRHCLLMTWKDFTGRFVVKDLRVAQERGIAGAKKYLFCVTERDAEAALAAHVSAARTDQIKVEEPAGSV